MSGAIRQHGPAGLIGTLLGALTAGALGYQQTNEVSTALERSQRNVMACHESYVALIVEFAQHRTGEGHP